MRISIISTTTHESNSTSKYISLILSRYLGGHEMNFIDANKLHIVKNLSCYSSGGKNCASKDAGKYRCWAHINSHKDPDLYGGKDEMGILYEAFENSDVTIFATSVRWGSHSALMQKIIERMNTLENRVSVYGEKSPLENKKCGVIVTGQHWKAQNVADHLISVFNLMGFKTNEFSQIAWQNSWNFNEEQIGNNIDNLIYDMAVDENNSITDFLTKGLGLLPYKLGQ